MYKLNVIEVLDMARKHRNNGAAMQSSAELCYADAVTLCLQSRFEASRHRAIKSLGYSVGVFHPDYQAAKEEI